MTDAAVIPPVAPRRPRVTRRAAAMLALIVGLLALTIAFVSGGLSAQQRRGEAQELYSHAQDVLSAGRAVMSTAQDFEIGERGYLLSRDEAYLDPYLRAEREIDGQMARLKTLIVAEPRQQQLVNELERLIAGLRLALGQQIASAKAGKFDEASASFRLDAGKKVMDRIRETMTALLDREEQRLDERRETASASAQTLGWYLYGLGVVGAILIVLAVASTFTALNAGARAEMEALRARTALRLAASERRFRTITEAMPQIVWSSTADGRFDFVNARWRQYTGAPGTPKTWADHIHPDDRASVSEAWRRSIETGETYEKELRLRAADGSYRWFLCRASPLRNDAGEIETWLGAGTDIHEARLNSEARELISQELSHRIKNIFSVVGSLIALSGRQDPAQAAFASSLRNRVNALARAHEFVRPHSPASAARTGPRTFSAFIADLLGAYFDQASERVTFSGEDFSFGDKSATPLALFFHELGTNAAKYGALSTPEGKVEVTSRFDGEDVVITWKESGGPPIMGEPTREGFGTALARLSVEGQLDGSIAKAWDTDGLSVTVRIPRNVLKKK